MNTGCDKENDYSFSLKSAIAIRSLTLRALIVLIVVDQVS